MRIFGVCTWMVGFRRFRIPGTSLIPVSIAPLILVLPPFLMALNPSSRHRTSHLQWHLQCCKFPCVFAPPPQKKKRQSSSNAWCAKIWASSRACHKMHEEQVVKSEHSLGQRNLANKNVNNHDQETAFRISSKKKNAFSSSLYHVYIHFWNTSELRIYRKLRVSLEASLFFYTSAHSNPTIMEAKKCSYGKGHRRLGRTLSSLPWLLEEVSKSIGRPHFDQEPTSKDLLNDH